MYLPATYVIEVYGVNRAITVAMSLCSMGMWVTVNDYYTFGSIFIAVGLPFIFNSATKVAASWYGPNGRTLASMILLFAIFLPQFLSHTFKDKLENWDFPVAIIATVYIAVAYALVYDKPDFPPTLS